MIIVCVGVWIYDSHNPIIKGPERKDIKAIIHE